MHSSVERLRIGLLVGVGLLVAVIAAFLSYAHYRTHRILHDLPGRLGASITKEFGSYTYSQSVQGKTVFTIHAAQAVQHKNGNYTLHDVNLVMYGTKGDRADHISGSQFEYDEKAGVVHAVGLVHLDLQAPAAEGEAGKQQSGEKPAGEQPKGRASAVKDGAASDRVIHITTSGLVYSQKQAVAATDEQIEFSFAGLTGRALGAEYDANTGHVVLRSAVEVSGLERGQPLLLRATHAELDRQTELAKLDNARYSSEGETAAADEGTLHLRADGSAERIVGDRHVRLEQAGEGVVTSEHVDVTLSPQSKPQIGILTGAVHYVDDEPLRQAQGDAEQATLHFDGQGRVQHVSLAGSKGGAKSGGRVRSTERVRAAAEAVASPGKAAASTRLAAASTGAAAGWSERDLSAETVELALGTDAAGRTLLEEATAVGAARLTTVMLAAGAAGVTTSKLSGDRLQAHFIAVRGQSEVQTVHGVGHTVLEQIAATGVDQVSAGDTLMVNFREARTSVERPAAGDLAAGGKTAGGVEVASAVQVGDVAITRTVPAGGAGGGALGAGGDPDIQHATAERANYDGDRDLVTLTGGAQVTDAQSVLWANRVTLEQKTGNATAEGAVKATYLEASSRPGATQQPGTPAAQSGANAQSGAGNSPQPVHVLAARAELEHTAGRVTFYGDDGTRGAVAGPRLARMWQSGAPGQGGTQVEAPVLVLEQAQKRMTAHGADGGAAMAVHTVLVSAAGSGATPRQAGRDGRAGKAGTRGGAGIDPGPQVIRVTSREMVYSDALRQAEFTGGVRVLDGDGDLRAQQATVFLQSVGSGARSGSGPRAGQRPVQSAVSAGPLPGMLGGEVDHIVATGQVVVTQPGRRATGERLVYTAGDQMFVLTGTKAVPPKVVDAQQGTATGASLRFHSGDDSVVVSGDGEGSSGQKPRTETKVKE